MCNNFPNIRITEGNNFSLVLPLRSRTYVATKPIDEDIDPAQLENVVVTFGGVEYPAQITEQGVQIDLPATLAVGTYNILLTAEYLGSSIRAAYESAVTIVPWSAQSTAEQYIAGSPIVMRAAYVLSGALTDAELEALKQEYREKIAEAEQAKEEAEAAKREWEEKAADLDGVAQEATLTQGVQDIIASMPDTDGLATEENATENKDEILAAIEAASSRAFSGHLDEVGLSQIGWGEDDLSWFRKQVDWEADADEAMRVPQELIDAYNEYKNEHGGVVDSGFYYLHKGQWYFRYAPVIPYYPAHCLTNAPYMVACPAKFHEYVNDGYGAEQSLWHSNSFRYVPKITCSVPVNHPYGYWMQKMNIYKLVMEGLSGATMFGQVFHNSTFVVLHLTLKKAVVILEFAPASAQHVFIDALKISDMGSRDNRDWLSSCKTCYLKGLACSVRLVQAYITKKELLYAINNEASDGTTPYVITLSAGMYNKYANDADILAALANHSNFALASA